MSVINTDMKQVDYLSKSKQVKSSNKNGKQTDSTKTKMITDCTRCGNNHPIKKCPAYQSKCNKCHLTGHFAIKCKTNKKKIRNVDLIEEVDEETELYLGALEKDRACERDWHEIITFENDISVQAKLDTGAQCNVLTKKLVDKIR